MKYSKSSSSRLWRLAMSRQVQTGFVGVTLATIFYNERERLFESQMFGVKLDSLAPSSISQKLKDYTVPTVDTTQFKRPPPRENILSEMKDSSIMWDLIIIGGGATGTGCALDAAARGLKVALVEQDDFSSGTSSKSTKLIHGGVRYLEKAFWSLDYNQYKLVKEALAERKVFLETAPYLTSSLPIMVPIYKWWQIPYFYVGTKMYDLLAGRENLQTSYYLSATKALNKFPMLKSENLKGALVYYDGQQNDARMNVILACTAINNGASVANHTEVVALLKDEQGKINGVEVQDKLTGKTWKMKSRGVLNATGPFTDAIRRMDDPKLPEIVSPSTGAHIILPGYYSPEGMGLIDPSSSDGRVVFYLPFLGQTIAGTTDTACTIEQNPVPSKSEVDFLLSEIRRYLSDDINVRREDVLATWSGIRPLIRDVTSTNTESLIRSHLVMTSKSGLMTIAGGKWTTYRQMAEDTIDEAVKYFELKPSFADSPTKKIKMIGSEQYRKLLYIALIQEFGFDEETSRHLCSSYGSRAWDVAELCKTGEGKIMMEKAKKLHPLCPFLEAEVRYAARHEFAETAADVIGRRTRLSFLNYRAALEALPKVIDIMAEEKGWSSRRKTEEWERTVQYLLSMGLPETMRSIKRSEVEKNIPDFWSKYTV